MEVVAWAVGLFGPDRQTSTLTQFFFDFSGKEMWRPKCCLNSQSYVNYWLMLPPALAIRLSSSTWHTLSLRTHLDQVGHCCTVGSCRPFWNQEATGDKSRASYFNAYHGQSKQRAWISLVACYTTLKTSNEYLSHSLTAGTHNFSKASLELNVWLTWVVDVGLAVFTPQRKLVVHWKMDKVT